MQAFAKIAAGVALAVLAYIAVGGAMVATAGALPMRGEMIDIGGGRRMHIVCEGPKTSAPTILFEAGAFGFSADWAAVQQKVVAQGLHACAYDRAGLGLSDPGPEPRDANAVVGDLEKLLKAAHEDGPFIVVGHSMAGLYLPLFAARNPDRITGLVFVDAATPAVSETASGRQFADAFAKASRLAALGARLGLFEPLKGTWLGDKYGLPPQASAEKRRAFASPSHNRWASAEVDTWMASAAEARAAGPLNPAWPVAVITAGKHRADLTSMTYAPARESRAGYSENVPAATHQSLVGLAYSDAVVRGIDHVRDAAAKSAP